MNTAGLVSDWLMAYPETTRDSYRRDVEQFDLWLGDRDLLAADRNDVQRWLAFLRDRLDRSPSTVRRKASALTSFYDYCVQERHLDHNPCEHIRRPRGENAPRRGLPIDQAQALIRAARERSKSAHALIWLLAGAGLRVTEACRARIEDLNGPLLLVKVKGGDTQIKPLSAQVLEAVSAAAGDRTEGPIVLSQWRQPMSKRTAWRMVSELTDQVGIENCTPHTLRHTAATLALEAGAEVVEVQALLGHKSPQTTLRYVRNWNALGGARRAAERLGAALTGKERG